MTDRGWAAYGLSLSEPDYRFVADFRTWVRAYETQVSGLVTDVVDVFPVARFAGFEHRVKTLDSLARKVATDRVEDPSLSLPEVVAGTGDVLRYSVVVPDAAFAATTQRATVELFDRGCSQVGVKNGFVLGQNDYRGYNTKWRTGEQVPFEVQFHTQKSWNAGKKTHGFYEELRIPGIDLVRKEKLEGDRRLVYEKVPIPDGVDRIVSPDAFPAHARSWRSQVVLPTVSPRPSRRGPQGRQRGMGRGD